MFPVNCTRKDLSLGRAGFEWFNVKSTGSLKRIIVFSKRSAVSDKRFLVHSMRKNVNMMHERVNFYDPNHARVRKYMRACVCTCVPARSFQKDGFNGIKRVSGVFPLLFSADERVLSARFDSNVVKNHSTKREQNPHLMPALSKYERLEFSSCPFGFYFVRIQLGRTQVSHVTRLFTVLSLFKIYAVPFLIFFITLQYDFLRLPQKKIS